MTRCDFPSLSAEEKECRRRYEKFWKLGMEEWLHRSAFEKIKFIFGSFDKKKMKVGKTTISFTPIDCYFKKPSQDDEIL